LGKRDWDREATLSRTPFGTAVICLQTKRE
jgi:hypothetical protein